MKVDIQSFTQLLTLYPLGLTELSREYRKSDSFCFAWRERNYIPAEYWPKLIKLYAAEGMAIDEKMLTKLAVKSKKDK